MEIDSQGLPLRLFGKDIVQFDFFDGGASPYEEPRTLEYAAGDVGNLEVPADWTVSLDCGGCQAISATNIQLLLVAARIAAKLSVCLSIP